MPALLADALRDALASRARVVLPADGKSPAAVLVPLLDVDGEPHVLYTRRSSALPRHRGEVAFPGGRHHPDEDADLRATALRETHEEIGVAPALLRVVGRLTPVFISVSGYRMEPFVAVARGRPPFRVAEEEVDELLEIELARLLDPRLRAQRVAPRDGIDVVIPYFAIDGREIWGATAMVLAELAAVLAEIGLAAGYEGAWSHRRRPRAPSSRSPRRRARSAIRRRRRRARRRRGAATSIPAPARSSRPRSTPSC